MLLTFFRSVTKKFSLVRIYVALCTFVCFGTVYYLTIHKNEKLTRIVVNDDSNEVFSKEKEPNYYLKLKSNCECRKEGVFVEQLNDKYRVSIVNNKKKKKSYDTNAKLESITCDLYNVFRRGPNQKVIGISLYGTDNRYYKSLKYIAKQAAKHYPEWIIRIYYDKSILNSIICEIECLKDDDDDKDGGKLLDNVDFCSINNIPNGLPSNTWSCDYTHSMKWRWLPIGDPFVDVFLSRDSDSWFHDREYEAVREWLKTDYPFHLMRGFIYYFYF
jgi:hypothetical protein